MLNLDELGGWIGNYYGQPDDRIYRLELLPVYDVADDGEDYRRWLAGATEPTWERKRPWLDTLRAERAVGMDPCRVRVLSEDLTDYERYACEFGYLYNAPAGEDVRVLRRGEHPIPPGLDQDYWLINDEQAALMHYDDGGRFQGAEVVRGAEVARYVRARDDAMAAAVPFLDWWDRHPELHRRRAA